MSGRLARCDSGMGRASCRFVMVMTGSCFLVRRIRPHPSVQGEDQLQRGVGDGQGAGKQEYHVRHHADPFQRVVGAAHEVGQAAGVPVAIGEDIPELDYASGEQIQDHHQGQADVKAPEADTDELLRPLPGRVALRARRQKTRTARASIPKTPNMAAWP